MNSPAFAQVRIELLYRDCMRSKDIYIIEI
jgi:hypothetical protein